MYNSDMLGENLRRIRQERGMTQAALAKKINITPQNISKWEKGICMPDLNNLCLLARAFGVTPDTLLARKVEEKVYISIDGGGTKTEFCLFTADGGVLERVVLGASNPNVIGIQATKERLKSGIDALLTTKHQVAKIYAGVSGCGVSESIREALAAYLKECYPLTEVEIDGDLLNVVYSTEYYNACIVAIIGTGSVVASSGKEGISRVGGWGYLFDEGLSGFGVGRDAVLAALKDHDGVGERTILTKYIVEELGTDPFSALTTLYSDNNKRIAALAPLVFAAYRKGDAVARKIIEARIDSLRDMLLALNSRYGYTDVVMAGGLTREADIITGYFVDTPLNIHFPTLPPIYGASVRCILGDREIDKEFKENFEATYKVRLGE